MLDMVRGVTPTKEELNPAAAEDKENGAEP